MVRIDDHTNEVSLCCPRFFDSVIRGIFVVDGLGLLYPKIRIHDIEDLVLAYCPFCGKPFSQETHGKNEIGVH